MDRRNFVKRISTLPLMAGVVPIVAQAVKAERAIPLEELIPDAAVVNPEFDDLAKTIAPLDGMRVVCEVEATIFSYEGDPLPEIGAPIVIECHDIRSIGRIVQVDFDIRPGARLCHQIKAVAQQVEQLPLVISATEPIRTDRSPRLAMNSVCTIGGVEQAMGDARISTSVHHSYFHTAEDFELQGPGGPFGGGPPGRLALE